LLFSLGPACCCRQASRYTATEDEAAQDLRLLQQANHSSNVVKRNTCR
jgi:hypothetical protein